MSFFVLFISVYIYMQLGVVLYALFFFLFFFFRYTVLLIKGIRGGLRESILSVFK